MNKIFKQNLTYFGLYLIASLIILRQVIVRDNPGLIYDWGNQLIGFGHFINESLYIYSQVSNGIVSGQKTFFLYNIIHQLISYTNINVLLYYKILFVGLFALGGYGMFLLLKIKKFSNVPAFLAGLFYIVSPVLITRFAAGYLGYLISGAFFPLLILFYFKASSQPKKLNIYIVYAVLCSWLAFTQIHFAAFFLIFISIDILLSFILKRPGFGKILATFLILSLYALLNASWIGFVFLYARSIVGGSSLDSLAFVSRLDTLPHHFWNTLLLADHGNTDQIFVAINQSWARLSFGMISLATMFWLGYKNIERRYLYIFSILVISVVIVMSVGATPPFQNIYPILFSKVPGLSMFREAYHLEYLILFAYCIVLAIAIEKTFLGINKINFKNKFYPKVLPPILIIFLIIMFNLTSFSGDLYGYMGSVNLPKDLKAVNQRINELTRDRIFYPPNLSFWKLKDDKRSGINYPDNIAYSFDSSPVNQASSDLDGKNLSWKLRNAVANDFVMKDGGFTTLLPYLGSNLIVDRKYLDSYYFLSVGIDQLRHELRQRWMDETNEQKLESYPDLKKEAVSDQTDIYQLNDQKGLVYLSKNSANVCNYANTSNDIDSFFYQPNKAISPYLIDKCSDKIGQAFADSENKLNFGTIKTLKHNGNFGWSPGYLSFYESKVFSDTINDFLFTRVADQFSFNLSQKNMSDTLYLRYFSSARSGKISVNDTIIETKGETEQWVDVQINPSLDGQYSVKSLDGENAIGGLVFLDQRDFTATDSVYAQKQLGAGDLSWDKINPTKYKINLKSQSTGDKLIILSENFNSGWKLKIGGETIDPIMVNTYANGFLVPDGVEGSGTIEFAPQKLYRTLLFTSFGIVLLLIGAVIWMSVARRRVKVRS
ncbi:MAG: hypothetical protein WCO23_03990 [bacterium]